METGLDRGVRDPELDQPGRRPRVETLAPFQLLVVNPFLVLVAWLVAFLLARHGVHLKRLPWFLAGLALGLGAPLLLQCHCLDCGGTVWLPKRARHSCRRVSARVHANQSRPALFPSLILQLVFWTASTLLIIGAVLLRGLAR